QAIEEERGKGRRARPRGLELGAEPTHGLLERAWAPFRPQRHRFPIQDDRLAGSDSTDSTSSGTRDVASARVRVNTRTSDPRRWTWTRAPSSFHSTAAGAIRPIASSRSAAL